MDGFLIPGFPQITEYTSFIGSFTGSFTGSFPPFLVEEFGFTGSFPAWDTDL